MGAEREIVVAGGAVVTGGARGSVIPDAAVALRGTCVAAVGPLGEVLDGHPDAEVIDATGRLVMPGLVNAHTHLYSALARGLIAEIEPSASFTEILEHLWWRLDRALTHDAIRASALAGALDLIRNGTTTIVDHHASQVTVEGTLTSVAEALSEAGLRANLCFEVTDREGPAKRDEGLAENERFASEVGGGADYRLLTASVGLHASFTLEDETLERAVAMAKRFGIGCHVHVAEDRADVEDSVRRSGGRVVERLHSFGVLGPKTIAAHCIHVDERERTLLTETDTIVVHNPQSNMNNAVGCAAVPTLLDEGALVGLGTDGFTASMFDEMKVANLIHRHEAGDPRVGHGVGPRLCLENNPVAATRLFGETVGVLEPGARADIIVLDYDPPTPLETGNLAGHVIFGLTGWMVETVIVNGRTVMRDREILTVDEEEVLANARACARDLWKAM